MKTLLVLFLPVALIFFVVVLAVYVLFDVISVVLSLKSFRVVHVLIDVIFVRLVLAVFIIAIGL